MRMKSILLIPAMAALGAVHAQAPPMPATPMAQTAPPEPQRAAECAPVKPDAQHGPNTGEGTTTGQANEALGDKLAKSNGVLCPPANVDPEMRAPTPDTGNTPVIPPPGSPGGNPHVQPK
jgi:hypothetical protein